MGPPPWHFSGDALVVDYSVDPAATGRYFPADIRPDPDGAASIVFADWASSSEYDDRLATDPARGQHRECYVVLYGVLAGRRVGRIAGVWVDTDVSLIRGHIQGFPKELGAVYLTKTTSIGRAGARRGIGYAFHAHASARGSRLATASVTITAESDRRPRGLTTPLVHTRLWPSLTSTQPAVYERTRGVIDGFEVDDAWVGAATLSIEGTGGGLASLQPTAVHSGFVTSVAFTVLGGTTEGEALWAPA